ncbi:hypothetical protein MAR_028014 [Mya arenaria]|uniref:Uncharacterized protein n=1 Tax=Mya arenaria TaxID=6604 RepID=A0ABY7DCC9_MYAAR|nr:hypothetical protein MAR_028014 [Mya arenaria]
MEAYDRNQNSHREDDLLPELNMSLPKTSGYRDVNSDAKMAPITIEKAIEYMDQYRVEFDEKVKDLYDDKFLLYMGLCSSPSLDFVRGACKAEMRKKVNYVVDISLHKYGYVQEMTNVVPSVTTIRIPCDQTRYGGKIGKLKNMKGSPCYMVKLLEHSHILIDRDLKRKAILKERLALQQGQHSGNVVQEKAHLDIASI